MSSVLEWFVFFDLFWVGLVTPGCLLCFIFLINKLLLSRKKKKKDRHFY